MNKSLTVLHLFLNELGIDEDIETIENRMTLQKAVYLGQRSGVDLGYRYGWYHKGPYCSSLADDYYSLSKISPESRNPESRALNETVKAKLQPIKDLFKIPDSIDLRLPQWLELLASWHYLRKVSQLNDTDAAERIRLSKPHLYAYIDEAKSALQAANLVQ